MVELKSVVASIRTIALRSVRQEIVGRNALARGVFRALRNQADALPALLILCTDRGLVLDLTSPLEVEDLTGYTLTEDAFRLNGDSWRIHAGQEGYRLISSAQPGETALLEKLIAGIDAMLRVFDSSERHNQRLLECLDSVRNAISIYDKEAHLLYANTQFCKYFCIDDRSAVLGMNIRDIMTRTGLRIYSMESDSSSLKMFDVLKTGKPALDWEVRIESKNAPDSARLASNDLYPVVGPNGEVEGMVELARSHQQEMKRTRKILGLAAEYSFDDIIGASPAIRKTIRQAKEYAANPFNFLLTGESGVGKELFAQSIHNASANRKGPFVALNCASIPEGLIESELFGYGGGAFTGASKNGQVGKFELADGGTLFLDEIGELPYHFQSKLLRVLETWTVTRIGSSRPIPINVRLIAATNRNLEEMVADGLFRQDLYYRLQVLSIEIPPLRERGTDILLLAESFLRQFVDADSGLAKTLDATTRKAMLEYEWPGNVRELRNVINRIAILSKDRIVTRDILEAAISSRGAMPAKNHPPPKASSKTTGEKIAPPE
ncbi:MAG: sigma 54-interacting transcriptional regulator [Planctomycetaceae bacterium]|nr:sigma 54-interacting transcriptional regulator [Planctomycetaceae bacterium]